MKIEDYESYKAVPLKISIAQHHNGNTTAFAKTQCVRYDQVGRWLKRNCVVIDGTVYCEVSKKKEPPNNKQPSKP